VAGREGVRVTGAGPWRLPLAVRRRPASSRRDGSGQFGGRAIRCHDCSGWWKGGGGWYCRVFDFAESQSLRGSAHLTYASFVRLSLWQSVTDGCQTNGFSSARS